MLQDLVLAAVNEAARKVDEPRSRRRWAALTGGMKLPGDADRWTTRPRSSADRRAAAAAGHRPQVGAAHRVPPAARHREDDAARSPRRSRRCSTAIRTVLGVPRRHRPRALRASARTPRAADRTICVVEEPHDLVAVETHARLPGPLPRAARRAFAASGHRPRRAARSQGSLERVRRAAWRRSSWPRARPSRARRPPSTSPGSKPLGVRVTRIAMGVPVGRDLEWADEVTMAKALEGRREY